MYSCLLTRCPPGENQGRMIFTGLTPPYLLYRIAYYYYYCSCCCCSSTSQLSGRMRSTSTLTRPKCPVKKITQLNMSMCQRYVQYYTVC
ncbi:hypothetical protein J4Q44_G00344660 [Coregonus suidteri]|uniref:Uncharacterized protein n=1 Tax=Coregonus suidteri TaxID=861788 RepID=A0AAN8L0E2_9TELE